MADVSSAIQLAEDGTPFWRDRFQAAIDRLSQVPAAARLRALLWRDVSHQLFRVTASPLRASPTPDRVPVSLLPILTQFFVALEPEPVDLFPDGVAVGSNLLGAVAPIQGALLPARVTGQDSGGTRLAIEGLLLVPSYCALPAHVLPRSKDEVEITVYFGPRDVVCAAYDKDRDMLMLDRVGEGAVDRRDGHSEPVQ